MSEQSKKQLRLKFIVCSVLRREAYFCAARSDNIIEVHLLPQGLHNEPDKLRTSVQEALAGIEDVQGNRFDAIILGYGLCSNGIVGLSCELPLIIPRAHDCITLLLGSKEKYKEYFDTHRGVYWYSLGWLESTPMPGKERVEMTRAEYVQKYGEDNADFLMEMEQNWMKEYKWATFVQWDKLPSNEAIEYTKQCAEYMNWNYDHLKGSPTLIQKMIEGDWNEQDFLILQPGQTIAEDLTNPGIIKAE